jgi:hypothetical protein
MWAPRLTIAVWRWLACFPLALGLASPPLTPAEAAGKLPNNVIPAHYHTDNAHERRGQIVAFGRFVRRRSYRARTLALHRGDKAVAAARNIGDVASASAAIAERFAQCGDMDPQRALVNDRVGPGPGDELLFWERVAGAFDQCDQNVERATAETQRLPVVEQDSLRRDQPERSKDEGLVILRGERS